MAERVLRPYQNKLINAIRESYLRGNRKILLQLPTGGGKSVIFSKIIGGANKKQSGMLFLVHRRELINQASEHLGHEGVPHGIIMAGVMADRDNRNQLASIQTLWSRCFQKEMIPVPAGDVVVIDEAHHVGSMTFDEILKYYEDSFVLGVTATPTRKNGKGLGEYFEDLILARDYGASVRDLMDAGFLAEASYMVPAVPDLDGVRVARGDYVEDQLASVMDDAKLIGDLVDHYKKHAEHRKAIAFAVNVAHSVHIRDAFSAAGIPAAHIDGKTGIEEREQIIADYESGRYQVLTNCEIFTEGYDMPAVDAIIMARPTKSLRMYLQMGGRGLRPKDDGGDCLILDHAGNVLRHGPLDEEHEWSLDERTTVQQRDAERKADDEEEGGEKEEKEYRCESCGFVFKHQALCPKCGTPLPKFAKDMETARGELVGLPGTKKPKKKKATREEKQRWWSYFLSYASQKGYKPGWAFHKYQEKFGVAPRGLEDRRHLGDYPVEFKNYIKHLNIKFAKSKHRRRA